MKKLLLGALLLLSTSSFSQLKKIDTLTVTAKTLSWFKTVYVQEHFKDPYSYKLMGHQTIVITMKQWIENDLVFSQKWFEKYNSTEIVGSLL